jgi:hypothetical protein
MPDPAPVYDAPTAVSSTAPDATQSASPADPLDALNPDQLTAWRMTGTLPDASAVTPPPAGSAPATPGPAQAGSTDPHAQSVGSDPAATPRGNADTRIPELLRDRAAERARADAAERRLAALEHERARPAAPDAKPAASSAAAAPDGKPDPETFPYGTSDPAYLEALTDWKVGQQFATARRQADEHAQAQRVVATFQTRAEVLRAKYPDFDQVALHTPTEIQPGSVVDHYVLTKPAGPDVLYHLHQPANAAERRRILNLAPDDQFEALIRLGDRLTAPPGGARSTHAPDPPVVLSSRATPSDAAERALAAGDDDQYTGAYLAEMNRREMASRRR